MTVVAIVLSIAGCTKSDRPPLASVHGTVTLDGQPLSGGFIKFMPAAGRSSRAVCDEAGNYELIYIRNDKGAVVGKHSVIITTQFELEAGFEDSGIELDEQPRMPSGERVPRRYNLDTELSAMVERGKRNEFNFKLTSDK